MRHKKIELVFILLTSALFFSVRCPQTQTPVEPPSSETYRINFSQGTRIATEYGVYKCEFSEPRTVYVGGFRDASNQTVVWVQRGTDTLDYWVLKNATNAYFDTETGEYAAPLDLGNVPFFQGDYTYTFHLGYPRLGGPFVSVYRRDATIRVFSRRRNYYIEYSCMGSTYDLRSTGYQFISKVTSAYSEANTNFRIDNVFNTNIDPADLDFPLTHQNLINWGDQYVSNGQNHDPNIVVLFGVRDYTASGLRYGITAWDTAAPSPRKSYAFVFGKRIDDNETGQNRQVAKTRVAIHELGHARGKDEYSDELGDGSLHSGQYQSVCVMGGVQYDPEKAFHFCEKHKQVLLNILW